MNSPTRKKVRLTLNDGEIDHSEILISQMAELCMSEEFSDVYFQIKNVKIPGHIIILATRSKYFRALCTGFTESKQHVIQIKAPIEAFKALLTYIYSGHISLAQMSEENILDTLRLANECECTELELSISVYLSHMITLDNVCSIFDTVRVLCLPMIQNVCLSLLDSNANLIMIHESFMKLSEAALKSIISRDSFSSPEVQIFNAVMEWRKRNSNVATESLISLIRLPLMSLDELLQVVRNSGVFDSDTLLKVIDEKSNSTSLPWRNGLWQEQNVATGKFGARVTEGECGSSLLDGDTTSFDLDKGFTRHCITADHFKKIIVELGSVTFINHIKLLLLGRDYRSYSYFIDVSVDKALWERVVDYQRYHCRSWQFLYFKLIPVRYIKLVGTHSSQIPIFEVISLEAYYTAKIPTVIDGLVAPSKNVATIKMGAIVVPDNNTHLSMNLLNGDFINYDDTTGYTYNYIGKGSVMVQLGQPYVIESMRFLLWDLNDDINYSYYIETSINKKDWEIVVDKQNEACCSWQYLNFEKRTMVYIKIVGTNTNSPSEDKIISYVHFECPSQILDASEEDEEEEVI